MSRRTLLAPSWVLIAPGELRSDVVVLVEDQGIAYVGADNGFDADRIDLPGCVLLPGLANLHTHLAAGPLSRAVAEDHPLENGMPFYLSMSPLYALGGEPRFRGEMRALMAWDVACAIRSGTTLLLDHASSDVEGHFGVLAASGIRAYSGPNLPSDSRHRLGVLTAIGEEHPESASEGEQASELAALEALFSLHDGSADGRLRVTLGPGGAHTTEMSVMKDIADFARRFDCPVTTHLCQAPSELAITASKFGRTPLRVLEEAGLLDVRLIAAHGTYLPEEDFALAAAGSLTIAHCASRKAKEGLTSPLTDFLDAGIPVALGSDAFRVDMFDELRTAALLAKVRSHRVDTPSSPDMLDLAVTSPAKALGRDDLGRIEPGFLADLVAVDLVHGFGAPVADVEQSLVHYTSGRDVTFSMIDGVVRVRDGILVGVDEPALAEAATAAAGVIWAEAAERSALPSGGGRDGWAVS